MSPPRNSKISVESRRLQSKVVVDIIVVTSSVSPMPHRRFVTSSHHCTKYSHCVCFACCREREKFESVKISSWLGKEWVTVFPNRDKSCDQLGLWPAEINVASWYISERLEKDICGSMK